MTKTISRQQLEMLLTRMQENPDIARGFVKSADKRSIVAQFWKNLHKELNSAGPPIKSICEWKKAWIDQKSYVRKKVATNKQHERGTGGGPNKQYKLSPNEQAIYELLGTQEAVEGISGAKSFGLLCSANKDVTDDNSNLDSSGYLVEDLIEESPQSDDDEVMPSTSTQKKKQKMSTMDVVEKELEVQTKLCSSVIELCSVFKSHAKEMEYYAKKMNRALGELNETKKKEHEETKRHNIAMETLRRTEYEDVLC